LRASEVARRAFPKTWRSSSRQYRPLQRLQHIQGGRHGAKSKQHGQNPERCRMARPFTFPAEGSANAVPRSKPNKNAAFCTSNAPATPAIDAVAAEISSLQRAPDAAQRAAPRPGHEVSLRIARRAGACYAKTVPHASKLIVRKSAHVSAIYLSSPGHRAVD